MNAIPPRRRGRPKHPVTPLTQSAGGGGPPFVHALPSHNKRRGPFAPGYLTPNQAAEEIGLTGEAIKQWIYKRQLPAIKEVNGYWRINREDFLSFLEQRVRPEARLVLIADDDPVFGDAAKKVLLEAAFRVLIGINAADAVLKAQNHPPTLLVVNLAMDGSQGWTVAKQIRALRHTRTVPILFVGSTALSPAEMSELLEIRGQAFLRKPVDPSSLMLELRRALGPLVSSSG